MDIQYNAKSCKKPIIYAEDLEYYAKQLMTLVTIYRNSIYIKSDAQANALNELEYYAQQLISKNYDMVISNANEIISYQDPLTVPPWNNPDWI